MNCFQHPLPKKDGETSYHFRRRTLITLQWIRSRRLLCCSLRHMSEQTKPGQPKYDYPENHENEWTYENTEELTNWAK